MRAAAIAGLTALLLLVGLAVWLRPLDPDVLSLQLAYTPRQFGDIVHAWSPGMLARYRAHLPIDFVLLASYGTFGHRLTTRWSVLAPQRWARGLLPAAAVCDAVENGFHLWLTEAPRFGVPWAYATSAGCAALKWALIVGFAGVVVRALLGPVR